MSTRRGTPPEQFNQLKPIEHWAAAKPEISLSKIDDQSLIRFLQAEGVKEEDYLRLFARRQREISQLCLDFAAGGAAELLMELQRHGEFRLQLSQPMNEGDQTSVTLNVGDSTLQAGIAAIKIPIYSDEEYLRLSSHIQRIGQDRLTESDLFGSH